MNILKYLQIIWCAVGGFIGWYLGGFDGFMIALLVFIVVDYITGISKAVINKNLNSEIGRKGICKKILTLLIVGVANILDVYLLKQGEVIRNITIFFYISNEGISIIENLGECGMEIPEPLKEAIKKLKGEDKK